VNKASGNGVAQGGCASGTCAPAAAIGGLMVVLAAKLIPKLMHRGDK